MSLWRKLLWLTVLAGVGFVATGTDCPVVNVFEEIEQALTSDGDDDDD